MAEGVFVSYLRVSTKEQGRSGLGLEAQRAAVAAYLNGGCWKLVAEYVEIESGRKADRPQLAAALAHCRATGARLVVAKIDRLARNVHFLSGLMESGADFVAADMPSINRLTAHIYAAVAEDEARRISERTRDALAAAKARGTKLGGTRRRKTTTEAGQAGEVVMALTDDVRAAAVCARRDKAALRLADLRPIVEKVRADLGPGASLRQLAAELTARSVKTPAGKDGWQAVQVGRILSSGG